MLDSWFVDRIIRLEETAEIVNFVLCLFYFSFFLFVILYILVRYRIRCGQIAAKGIWKHRFIAYLVFTPKKKK